VYEGEWKDDKRNGQGKWVHPSGQVYEGEWKDDKQNGQGKWVWPNGQVYEGEWNDGAIETFDVSPRLFFHDRQSPFYHCITRGGMIDCHFYSIACCPRERARAARYWAEVRAQTAAIRDASDASTEARFGECFRPTSTAAAATAPTLCAPTDVHAPVGDPPCARRPTVV
jgi:hypothetical protein